MACMAKWILPTLLTAVNDLPLATCAANNTAVDTASDLWPRDLYIALSLLLFSVLYIVLIPGVLFYIHCRPRGAVGPAEEDSEDDKVIV